MDQVIQLLIGILVAAGIFAATLFSAVQIYRAAGRLRLAHAAAAALTLAAMACLSLGWWGAAQAAGALLCLAALAALALERGWNRLLPAFQLLFGAALLARLPFGG
ncbi:hypothetical protein GE300_04990 [Rhodobacteraceae bacterium 2CG4]|uniref:Uncharacterized protein n=1 Tax=Halovulum marinum TaxID=2662447 RepID=A0A6L5YYJ8_9RHOB|nr:hypothetical protein [Halovulum marinum]MSU88980.1 hypothetical protein [Halovulum marinum]